MPVTPAPGQPRPPGPPEAAPCRSLVFEPPPTVAPTFLQAAEPDLCLGSSGAVRLGTTAAAASKQPHVDPCASPAQRPSPRGSAHSHSLQGTDPCRSPRAPAITARARGLRREGRVEDRLLSRHRQSVERTQQRRQSAEADQLREVRPPELAKASKRLRRTGTAHERLYADAALATARAEARREDRRREAEAALPQGKPRINAYSSTLQRPQGCLWDWDSERQRKVTEQQRRRAEDEIADLRDAPAINSVSAVIASASGRGPRVEEGLMQKGSQRRDRIARLAAAADAPRSPTHSPRCGASERLYPVTPRASPRRAGGSLTPRSRARRDPQGAWERCTTPPAAANLDDPDATFQPCITPRSRALAQSRAESRTVWDALHADRDERECRRRAAEPTTPEHRTSPRISHRTRQLAREARERDAEEAGGESGLAKLLVRLSRPTGHVKSRVTAESLAKRDANARFAPVVSAASAELDRRRYPDVGDRVKLLHALGRDKERRLTALRTDHRQQQEEAEKEACMQPRRRSRSRSPLVYRRQQSEALCRQSSAAMYEPESAAALYGPESAAALSPPPSEPSSPDCPSAAPSAHATTSLSDSGAFEPWLREIRQLRQQRAAAEAEASFQSEDREFAPDPRT
eukprot:TRINITY_DN12435_c0_g1_i1.p1 TRINITY_DN12435_c0_g1~~TRINITY_DN12435_c0_g1_i1.p1  ORF type:complete len:646 (+),score=208.31 TRINITY_DN12435_c0_g1_i1:37-1938(+)